MNVAPEAARARLRRAQPERVRAAGAWASLAVIAALSACSTPPPEAPRPPPPTIPVAVVAPVSLPAEGRRLASLFAGTPVAVTNPPDGSLRVELPLLACFDRGSATVKPMLAAALDQLAAGQRDQSTSLVVTAPPDAGSTALLLGIERAGGARDYLAERGVAASRFSVAATARGRVVRIVVTVARSS